MTKFVLEITMGNDAMQDGADVAGLLRDAADYLESGGTSDTLYDYNGNKVGTYTFEEEN